MSDGRRIQGTRQALARFVQPACTTRPRSSLGVHRAARGDADRTIILASGRHGQGICLWCLPGLLIRKDGSASMGYDGFAQTITQEARHAQYGRSPRKVQALDRRPGSGARLLPPCSSTACFPTSPPISTVSPRSGSTRCATCGRCCPGARSPLLPRPMIRSCGWKPQPRIWDGLPRRLRNASWKYTGPARAIGMKKNRPPGSQPGRDARRGSSPLPTPVAPCPPPAGRDRAPTVDPVRPAAPGPPGRLRLPAGVTCTRQSPRNGHVDHPLPSGGRALANGAEENQHDSCLRVFVEVLRFARLAAATSFT
jgi:hypothetical protein